MHEGGSSTSAKRAIPWLEITLTVILVLMLIASLSALFGRDIRQGIENYCTQQELWCAPPTPTPTITPTPTVTPRPTSTITPTAMMTSSPTP
jgi:hypothetical protein